MPERHEHVWEQATEDDLSFYLAMNEITKLPPEFVRLDRCAVCAHHALLVRKSRTGEIERRDAQYIG